MPADGIRAEGEPRISFKGVELPDARLIEFDEDTGIGKIELYPGGPILKLDGGKAKYVPEPTDPDLVDQYLGEIQEILQDMKDAKPRSPLS